MPTISDLRDKYTVEVALDDKATDQTDKLRTAFDRLSQAADDLSDAHGGVGDAAKVAAQAQAEFNQIVADFGNKVAQTPQQMALIATAADKIGTAAGSAAGSISGMTSALAQQGSNALSQSLNDAGKAAEGFGDKMNQVVVSVGPRGQTGSIFGGLKNLISDTTSTITGMFVSLSSIGQGSDDTNSKVGKLNSTFSSLGGWLEKVDDQLTTTKDSTKAVNDVADQAGDKIKTWGERIGGVLGPVAALTAAGITLGQQYRQHQRELDALATSLSGVRDNYLAVAQQIEATGRALHQTGPISAASAQDAAKIIAQSPNYDPSLGLTDLTKTAEKLASATGTSIQSTAQKIASALGDAAAAAKTANSEGLKGFDDGLVATIDLLQRSGDRLQAFQLYMEALKKSSADAKEALTPLQQAWRDFIGQFQMGDSNPIGRYFAAWIDWIENGLAGAIAKVSGYVKEFNEWLMSHFPQAYGPGGVAVTNTSTYSYSAATPLTGTASDPTIAGANRQYIDDALSVLKTKIPEELRAGLAGFATRVLQTESTGNMLDPVTGKILTSKAGNIGLMQLGPAVIQDYEQKAANIFSRSGDVQSARTEQGNVNIGASYIVDLYNKYGHDIVKTAIAYNWGPRFADEFFAGTRTQLPSETVGFVQKTTGVSYDQLQKAFPQLQGNAFKDQTYRDANALPLPDSTAKQRQDAWADIEKAKAALTEARKDADNAIANDDTEAFTTAARKIAEYNLKLDAATAAYRNIRSESQKAADDQVAAADKTGKHLDTLGDKLYDYEKKIRDIAAKSGNAVDEQSLARGLQAIRDEDAADNIDKQNKLVESFEKQTTAMDEANKKAIEFATTQGKAGTVTKDAADYVKVFTELTQKGIDPGEKFNEMLAARLKVMGETKQIQNDAQARQDIKDFAAQNEQLRDQFDLIGKGTKATAELNAEMEERHKWHKTLHDDLTLEQQAAVDAAKANADLKDSIQQQRQAIQELGQMFSSVFDSVSNSIIDAFVKGKASAIDFGNIMKGLATQIGKDFLQLSVLNPIANMFSMGGQTKPTLSTLFDAIGSMSQAGSGGTTGTSSGNATGINSATSSGSSLLSLGSNLWSTGKSIYGFFSGGGSTSVGTNSLVSSASNFLPGFGAASPFYGGAASESAMVAADSLAGAYETGATGAGMAGSLSGSAGTTGAGTIGGLSSAIPVVSGAAAGFAAGSMVGGAVQGALGKTGPAPMAGAAVGAVGGAILGQMLIPIPGVGALIGGVVGGVLGGGGGGLIGPKVASPYSSLMVNADQGTLHAGSFLSQKDPNAVQEMQAYAQQIGGLNDLMTKYGVWIDQQKSTMVQFGNNTPNKFQDPTKFQDLNTANVTGKTALQQFGFSSSDPILAQKLSTKDFATTTDLQTYLAGFTATQAAFATGVANVTAVMKSLGAVTGSVNDSIKQLNDGYAANKTNADALIASGYLSDDQVNQLIKSESDLADVRDRSVQQAEELANQEVQQQDQGRYLRRLQANAQTTGSQSDQLNVQLVSFDSQAVQQRQALSQLLVGLYGDAIKSSQLYGNEMADLETTLGQERVAIVTAYTQQIADQQAAVTQGDQSEISRYLQALAQLSGNQSDAMTASLYAFDAQAQQQRTALDKQLVAIYGTTIRSTAGYGAEMALLERTLGAERLAIQKQSNAAQLQTAEASVTNLQSYAAKLVSGSQSPLSPQAQYKLSSSQFATAYGSAATGNPQSLQNISSYADAFLQASSGYYGSGTQYVADFNRVLNSIDALASLTPDQLTAAVFQSETRSATQQLVDSLAQIRSEVAALRAQIAQGSLAPTRLAA